MASRSIIRTGRLPRLPWKNGAGTTREVAVFPGGSGPDSFRWRISVASIIEGAPFSTFPGVDRHFLVATPGTIEMTIPEGTAILTFGQSVSFPGEDEVAVQVLNGPVSAVNFMTDRTACSGAQHVQRVSGRVALKASTAALVMLVGSAQTEDGWKLGPMDILTCGPESETLNFTAATICTMHAWPNNTAFAE